MLKFMRIEIITSIDRQQTLLLLSDVISANDGWIVSHQLFSNMAASLAFEIPLPGVEKFLESLTVAGFTPRIEGEVPSGSKGDVRGNIAITFIHEESDLKRDVSAFG